MSTVNILKTTLSSSTTDITGQLDYETLFNDSETRLDMGFVVVLFIKASAETTKGIAALQTGSLQVTRTFNVRPSGNSRVTRSDVFTVTKASLFASGIDAASVFNNANSGLDLRLEVTPEPCASQTSIADQRLPIATQPTMALQFDGVNNYIEINSYDFNSLETRSTVEMWVRGGPQDTCLFYATSSDRARRQMSAHLPWSDGNVYFDKGGDLAGNVDRISKKMESTNTADTWNHWAFVRDDNVDRMAIYKNGVLWHEAGGMYRGMGGCTYFMIGADGKGNARYKGAICEVRIWCSARTEAQIKDNMNRRIPAGDSMLIASYALDQATTTITDRSGDNHHSTLRGSAVLVSGPPSLITTSGSTASPPPVVDTTDDLKGTITARGDNGSGEAKEKLFDNQRDSKWLDFSPQGSWVQYTYAAGIAGRLTSYSLTSANDAPERDPADWQLQGSNDGGATWTTVDTRTGVSFGERFQKQTFSVSGSPTYKAYRLNITKVLDPSSAGCVQLAELELLGQQVSA